MGSNSPPEQAAIMSQLQNNPATAFQHVKHELPLHSPPMRNGLPHHHRLPTPQTLGMSRPSSRNAIPNADVANAHTLHASQAANSQNTYAYLPNPPIFNAQAMSQPQRMPSRAATEYSQPSQPQYSHTPPAPMQNAFMQDHRRHSIPTNFTHQEQPQQITQSLQQNVMPRPVQHPLAETTMPQSDDNSHTIPITSQPRPPLPPSKSHSVYTPIDDSKSLLAQRWGSNTTADFPPPPPPPPPAPRQEQPFADNVSRDQKQDSEDRTSQSRSPPEDSGKSSRPSSGRQSLQTFRKVSLPPVASIPPPTPGTGSFSSDAKRPRLKVQIPSEQSDGESAGPESSSKDATGAPVTAATPAKASTETSHSSGVVLPPPSPSASALLSAGAQGPRNPFARPALPMAAGSFGNNSNSNIETPISALPSRFMQEALLSSPSNFYPPEWGFSRDSNVLPSPLTFQTPVATNIPSFRDGGSNSDEKKRKSDDADDAANSKRVKD